MSLLLIKFTAALFILIVSVFAGLKPLQMARAQPERDFLVLGEAFAGGIFLGIALFHMLPDAERDFNLAYGVMNYPYANLLCAFGFVLLLFLEKVILQIAEKHKVNHHSLVPYVLPIVLSVHALTEGTALGINTTLANTLIIFIAIIVHKGSESFALATNLGRSQLSMKRTLPIFLLWALMSPVGVAIGTTLAAGLQSRSGLIMAAVFNSFAAGTFLYIATLHKTTHICSHAKSHHFLEVSLLMLGLVVMAVVEIWL